MGDNVNSGGIAFPQQEGGGDIATFQFVRGDDGIVTFTAVMIDGSEEQLPFVWRMSQSQMMGFTNWLVQITAAGIGLAREEANESEQDSDDSD